VAKTLAGTGPCHTARQVLFHLGTLGSPNPPAAVPLSLEQRMVDVHEPVRDAFVGYLHRKSATCRPKTVSSLATRLSQFGRFLGELDPDLNSLVDLDRRRHIEPFITSLLEATNTMTGKPISVADRARRIHAASNFLAEIPEWGWDCAPPRRLIFTSDLPRLPRPLPRYLPVDADRRLTAALAASPNRLAAITITSASGCPPPRRAGPSLHHRSSWWAATALVNAFTSACECTAGRCSRHGGPSRRPRPPWTPSSPYRPRAPPHQPRSGKSARPRPARPAPGQAGLVPRCRATMPPVRFRQATSVHPACCSRAASTGCVGQARMDSAR